MSTSVRLRPEEDARRGGDGEQRPRLKQLINEELVRTLAAKLESAGSDFAANTFLHLALDDLESLELTGRAWQVAEAMHQSLPQPFPRAADILIASLGPELERTEGNGLAPLRYMPHVYFVQKYGLGHFETAMRAQYELTKRFSAEFSIRAFLVRHPRQTYECLRRWATDPNVHVRRLVSEGTRPRLPWAPRLQAFQQDPSPVLALLELLKEDPERYVQRSVANNLNDISKDHPDLAVETCRRWSSGSPRGEWIANHALRTLVKAGHRGALGIVGAGAKPQVAVADASITPPKVRLDDDVGFSFSVTSSSRQGQHLLIDYVVHFVKAGGGTRPKVFKLCRIDLPAGANVNLGSRISFREKTTRKHYPGRHRIEILVNGITHPLGDFEVLPD